MGDRLDDLLDELASTSQGEAAAGLETAVWRRVDARSSATRRLRSGVTLQCAIGACTLLMGFSYQAYQRGVLDAPRDPGASLRLLDGSTVADAETFQVLR